MKACLCFPFSANQHLTLWKFISDSAIHILHTDVWGKIKVEFIVHIHLPTQVHISPLSYTHFFLLNLLLLLLLVGGGFAISISCLVIVLCHLAWLMTIDWYEINDNFDINIYCKNLFLHISYWLKQCSNSYLSSWKKKRIGFIKDLYWKIQLSYIP